MNIRSKIYHGVSPPEDPVLLAKQPKGARPGDLLSVATRRFARRTSNHRLDDRHRLVDERARLRWDSSDHEIELINVSGGGAMVRGGLAPNLWDRVELHLGPNGTVECGVCWRRGDRLGLQFVDETRLDCPAGEVAALLRDVIARSFPEAEFKLSDEPAVKPQPPAPIADEGRGAPRHPLIWNGTLHHDYQSTGVRVRNISASGAMIESPVPVRVATEPLLELSDAVSISATVEWVVGDQVGLRFHTPFDMSLLARARPTVAEGWERPAYLDQGSARSAWDRRWERLDIGELRAELEGFMKR